MTDLAAVGARFDAALPRDGDGHCISIVTGATKDEVLLAFGCDPNEPPIPSEDAWDDEVEVVLVLERPGYVLVVEDYGFQGSRSEILASASAKGRAGNIYCLEGMYVLSLAAAGEAVFGEELDDDTEPEDPALLPYFADVDFRFDTLDASMLLVVERFTGVRLDGPPPERNALVHRIYPHLQTHSKEEVDPADIDEYAHHSEVWALGRDVGEPAAQAIYDRLKAADLRVRRGVAAYAVKRALRAAGIDAHPDLATTLASLESDPLLTAEAEQMIRRHDHVPVNTVTPPTHTALWALREAVGRESLGAAVDAVRLAAATLGIVAQAQDQPPGSKYVHWQNGKLPTPRGAYARGRDLRAFLGEVYARLGLTEADAPMPALPEPPALLPSAPWRAIAAWPHEPWHYAHAVWTGSLAFVFATDDERGDGPWLGDLPAARNAAAYDPRRNRWRAVADPPFLLSSACFAVLDSTVYALTQRQQGQWEYVAELWAYSVATNSWRQIVLPEGTDGLQLLEAAGSRLVLWRPSHAYAADDSPWFYEPATESWSEVPASPWEGSTLRQILGLPDGRLVRFDLPPREFPDTAEALLAALDAAANAEHDLEWPEDEPMSDGDVYDEDADGFVISLVEGTDEEASGHAVGRVTMSRYDRQVATWRIAVLEPGAPTWREIPSPPMAASDVDRGGWAFVAGKLVRAERGRSVVAAADGTSAKLPTGGVLDLETGSWEPLPHLPGLDWGEMTPGTDTRGKLGGAGDTVALHSRWALDPRRRAWIELPEIPDSPYGVVSSVSVWAGEQLLLFANARAEAIDDEPFDFATVPVRCGWAWTPIVED